MQNPASRHFLALSILSVAVLVAYLPLWQPVSPELTAQYQYVADVDYWQRTGREQWVGATFPFDLNHELAALPLEIGQWQGEDIPETNQEVFILLEPEQYVLREYINPQGQFVWLTLIAGRRLRSFHPPDLCYDADGWQTSLTSRAIPLANGSQLYGLWLSAQKELPRQSSPEHHRSFYFYLFPDSQRELDGGMVLVRLTSPPYGSDDETLALYADFLRHIFSTETTTATPPAVAGCGLDLPPGASDEQALHALLQAEGEGVVQQDIAALLPLWLEDGRVVDAGHTANNLDDDQVWAGVDAIRTRYLHHVFPGAPGMVAPAQLEIASDGEVATVTSTTRIGDEVSPNGDRWRMRKIDGCWKIEELVFNLEE